MICMGIVAEVQECEICAGVSNCLHGFGGFIGC